MSKLTWCNVKGIWKLRAEENRIAGRWIFLVIMHLFLMLAVPLGLSGFLLVEKCFGSGQRGAHRANQVSRKLNLHCSPLGNLLGGRGKSKFVLVLAPKLSYGVAYKCTFMLLEGLRPGRCSKGSPASFFLVVDLYDVSCEGAPGVSNQEIQSSCCLRCLF